MSDEINNNDATRPLKPDSEETQPIPSGEGLTQPVISARNEVAPSNDVPTSPVKATPETGGAPSQEKPVKPPRKKRGWLVLVGILIILAGAGLGGLFGYQAGMKERLDLQKSMVAREAATQFQYGLDSLNQGYYELARAHFEYVIKLDPSFPGVQQKLTQTLVELSATAVPPTSTPTPTLTPTPDTRGEQELFNQIQQNLLDKNWDGAIQASETLRNKNLAYRTVDVDGMYYIALRYRGMDRITRLGDLEGGMYDLALVQRFGPLDQQADSYRLYARYYAIGASFWEVDWEKAMTYFSQVAPSLPMLRDSSMITAIDRYRQASIRYAEKLVKDNEFCKAEKIFSAILTNNYKNATAEPLATQAYNECHPATETPTPTIAVTATVTLTRLTPAATTPPVKTATPTPPAATTAAPTVAPTTGASATPSGAGSPTSSPATATLTKAPPAASATPQPPTATRTPQTK